MATKQKIETVEFLEKTIKNSKGIYFTNYTGLDVSQMTLLRNEFRKKDILYKISKNRAGD